jgi:hypothetical protein
MNADETFLNYLCSSGMLKRMTGTQLKRYVALLYLRKLQDGSDQKLNFVHSQLREIDGIGRNSSLDAHVRLERLGLITIDKTRRPHHIILTEPRFWASAEKNEKR